MRPAARDAHAHAHELGQRVGVGGDVLGLAQVESPARAAPVAVDGRAVEHQQRIHQVARERAGDLARVGGEDVVPHFGVQVGHAAAQAGGLGLGAQHLAEDGLALRTVGPRHHVEVVAAFAAAGDLVDFQAHAVGHDRAGVVAQRGHRAHQAGFLLAGGALHVLADDDRQAVGLQELREVADAVGLVQEGPHQHAVQAHAPEVAGLDLGVLMQDPSHADRLGAVRAAVGQAQLAPAARQAEPGLRPGVKSGQPLHAPARPFQLDRGKAMAHRFHHAHDHVLEVVDGVAQQRLHHRRGLLFGPAGVARRLDGPVQPQHRARALVELAAQVCVAVVHVVEQLVLREDVALVGLAQDARGFGGRESVELALDHAVRERGHAGRLRLAQQAGIEGVAVLVDDAHGGPRGVTRGYAGLGGSTADS